MYTRRSTCEILLATSLDAAVPLWMLRIQAEAWAWETIAQTAREAAQVIAEKGDVLQFGGKPAGGAASAFNALAKGLACLAFCPGGVQFLGRRWEVTSQSDHADCAAIGANPFLTGDRD